MLVAPPDGEDKKSTPMLALSTVNSYTCRPPPHRKPRITVSESFN